MKQNHLSRRDFTKLTMAAFGGAVAGTMAGCGGAGEEDQAQTSAASEAVNDQYLLEEPHVCRYLNSCEGKGKGGDNACAGQGSTCATAEAHSCHGQNECKGQGGCGTTAGRNECAGKGECSVPLTDNKWKEVRTAWESAMKSAGKQFAPLPDAAG